MKGKFLCVMAQYDEETEQKLKKIQKILLDNGFKGKQTPNLPNHITLGTFEISEEEILKEKIKRVSNNFQSFDIKLNNIGLFGLDVLFIAPLVSHELLSLQQYFSSKYADDLDWTAHTTMLIESSDVIQRALPLLAENFKGFRGRIESISLYEFWPTRFIIEEKLI